MLLRTPNLPLEVEVEVEVEVKGEVEDKSNRRVCVVMRAVVLEKRVRGRVLKNRAPSRAHPRVRARSRVRPRGRVRACGQVRGRVRVMIVRVEHRFVSFTFDEADI